jgi:hypothetical protein
VLDEDTLRTYAVPYQYVWFKSLIESIYAPENITPDVIIDELDGGLESFEELFIW